MKNKNQMYLLSGIVAVALLAVGVMTYSGVGGQNAQVSARPAARAAVEAPVVVTAAPVAEVAPVVAEAPVVEAKVPTQEQKIKLGAIMPSTGELASDGKAYLEALRYRLSKLPNNIRDKFELVHVDDGCTGNTENSPNSTEAYNSLKAQGVKFIFGTFCSSAAKAIAPNFVEDGIVMLSSENANNADYPAGLEGVSPNYKSLSYTTDDIGKAIGHEICQLPQDETFAIISEDDDFAQTIRTKIRESCNFSDNPIANIIYPSGTPGGVLAGHVFLGAIKASGAHYVVLNPLASDPLIEAVNTLKSEDGGWDDVNFISHSQLEKANSLIANGNGSNWNGLTILNAYVTDPKVKAEIKVANGALKNNENLGGNSLSSILTDYYVASTFDTVDILTNLILENKGDVTKVRDALSNLVFKGRTETASGRIFWGDSNFVQGVKIGKSIFNGTEFVVQ